MDRTSLCSVGRYKIAVFVGSRFFFFFNVRHVRTSKIKTTSFSFNAHVCRVRTEIEALLSTCSCKKQCDRPHFDYLIYLL